MPSCKSMILPLGSRVKYFFKQGAVGKIVKEVNKGGWLKVQWEDGSVMSYQSGIEKLDDDGEPSMEVSLAGEELQEEGKAATVNAAEKPLETQEEMISKDEIVPNNHDASGLKEDKGGEGLATTLG